MLTEEEKYDMVWNIETYQQDNIAICENKLPIHNCRHIIDCLNICIKIINITKDKPHINIQYYINYMSTTHSGWSRDILNIIKECIRTYYEPLITLVLPKSYRFMLERKYLLEDHDVYVSRFLSLVSEEYLNEFIMQRNTLLRYIIPNIEGLSDILIKCGANIYMRDKLELCLKCSKEVFMEKFKQMYIAYKIEDITADEILRIIYIPHIPR